MCRDRWYDREALCDKCAIGTYMYNGVPMTVMAMVCCGLMVEAPKSATLQTHWLLTNRFCGFKSR
jgi:hypothetical protein